MECFNIERIKKDPTIHIVSIEKNNTGICKVIYIDLEKKKRHGD